MGRLVCDKIRSYVWHFDSATIQNLRQSLLGQGGGLDLRMFEMLRGRKYSCKIRRLTTPKNTIAGTPCRSNSYTTARSPRMSEKRDTDNPCPCPNACKESPAAAHRHQSSSFCSSSLSLSLSLPLTLLLLLLHPAINNQRSTRHVRAGAAEQERGGSAEVLCRHDAVVRCWR